MLNTKSFLCLDFGAGSLKAAEFEPTDSGAIRLKQFGIKPLGFEGSQDVARERVLNKAIQELLSERGFSARSINACAPGFHVFSKFVKLPPVDASKANQIIQYEAQQNVPFPLEEVAWDKQILGSTSSGELEVLLVAIKTDVVEAMFRTAEANGLQVQLVDVSPAALANAFRFNYGDLEGCSMLLDIGAKTSNLLFFEKGKVYSRGITIGANSITQDFGAEAKLKFAEAEQIKIAEGFVSLGGAYEEPDSPRQAQISKIARQVMTRLHIQVNQTIQFYRGQQGGSAPQRLFLAGGASIMPYTAQFFAEKLNIEVQYFNPFKNIEIDPGVDMESLASVAHALGEVVGLGLRNVAQCPVEMNLMPKAFLKRQQFNQKKPYFAATVFSLVLVVGAFGAFYGKLASIKDEALTKIGEKAQPLRTANASLEKEEARIAVLRKQSDALQLWLENRMFWPDLLLELRQVLKVAEATRQADMGGVENGVWIDSLVCANPGVAGGTAPAMAAAGGGAAEEAPAAQAAQGSGYSESYLKTMRDRYKIDPLAQGKKAASADGGGGEPDSAPVAVAAPVKRTVAPANEVSVFNITCRAVNLGSVDATANGKMAYALEAALRASPMFDPKETRLSGPITQSEEGNETFTFGLVIKLKKPMKL